MNRRSLHIALGLALLTMVVALAPGNAVGAISAEVSEQWLIYDINRARWDPVWFAANNGGFPVASTLHPMPPLAVNTSLMNSTGFKAQQTIDFTADFNSSTHCSNATGTSVCPNQLAVNHGYPIPQAWGGLNQNTIEVYWASNGSDFVPGAQVWMGQQLTWHRGIVFEWTDRHEIGVGWATKNCPGSSCENYVFAHVAGRIPQVTFITGVVYNDANSNWYMDINEGLAGVTVSRGGGVSVVTNAGGGYSLPAGPGSYTVTASGGGFSSKSTTVRVIDHNVAADFRSGSLSTVVREYPSRLAGSDRYATAVEVSRFSHPQGADTVYLAVGTNYPDALAAAPGAAAENAPILLTAASALPPSTMAELQRLTPNKIVVLGGPAAISDAVVAYLDANFPTVVRRYGATRYETATAISQGAFPGTVNTVYIATGEDFPDALIAGPAAAKEGAPLLLVRSSGTPAAVLVELARLNPDRIVIVGNTSAVPNSVAQQLDDIAQVTRISGADDYALSAAVAAAVFPTATTAYIATANNFPDALAAGPATKTASGPILLVGSTVPSVVGTELARTARGTLIVLGGPAAVPDAVIYKLADYLPQ